MDSVAFTDTELVAYTNKEGSIDMRTRRFKNMQPYTKPNIISQARNFMIKGLETLFYNIGVLIASYPIVTIVISIIVPSILCVGMNYFKFDEDFADLLLPPTSRIHTDRAWVQKHVPYEQRPIRLILKNKNVLTNSSMKALYNFHQQISALKVDGDEDFDSMCVRIGGLCFVDSLLALWRNDEKTIDSLTDQDIIDSINTVKSNPTYYFPFNATRMLGLIERNSTDHIVSAGIMHADWFIQSSITLRPTAKKLEYKAIDLALAGHPAFEMINVFTVDSYSEEFFKGVYGDIILIVYGFPVVLLYVILALGKCNVLEHGVYLTFAAVLGVILSAGACFGVGLVSGFLFGAPHQALIFLLLAVGIDDAFVIITTWNRINKANQDRSITERVGLTMQHAGVSVTVTSFSDLVAFACGISTQMPVLQSFCVYCSIGILFLFLMQSTLFPACLALNQRRIEASRDGCVPCVVHEQYKSNECSQVEFLSLFFKKIFAPAILSIQGKIIVIVMTLGMAGVMIYGVSGLQKGYEIERSLPVDSYTRHFLKSQRLYFSSEGPGIQTFCGPMDYQKNIMALDRMANEYVNSSVIMYGLVANWIPIFKIYGAFNPSIQKNADGFPADKAEFYRLLKRYFESPFGIPFSKYIGMTDEDPPSIQWTYFPMQQIVSQDVWENEYIMREVRRIADEADLDNGTCFCYSLFHIFTEVIRYVDFEIMRNFLLAGAAVFVVTLLLIVDVVTSFFVLICVCLTTLDIMGALHFWDFYLDVNLVVLLIISIGLAVDFSAHVGYTFMTLTGTRKERAANTLVQIGPAISHGAATTFLVFFVLIFGRSLSSFFAVFIMVVLFGLFHGLCFLPVVLSMIGPSPYYNAGPDGTINDRNYQQHTAGEDQGIENAAAEIDSAEKGAAETVTVTNADTNGDAMPLKKLEVNGLFDIAVPEKSYGTMNGDTGSEVNHGKMNGGTGSEVNHGTMNGDTGSEVNHETMNGDTGSEVKLGTMNGDTGSEVNHETMNGDTGSEVKLGTMNGDTGSEVKLGTMNGDTGSEVNHQAINGDTGSEVNHETMNGEPGSDVNHTRL